MHAVFLDYDTVSYNDLDSTQLRRAMPSLQLYADTSEAQLVERIGAAEIILLNKPKLTRERLAAALSLRVIAVAGTGTDHIDLLAARERGIAVCNVRGYCTSSVVQLVWSMVLSLTQHLPEFNRLATNGTWSAGLAQDLRGLPIRELAGRTLGIVGWGNLGRAVAEVGAAFGMRVLVAQRPGAVPVADRIELPELLAMADVVSLHCPLTESTRGLIGARELALMQAHALLINTARGGLIDSAALRDALIGARLGGAGIDALVQEPPLDGDPLLEPGIPNLLITPHIGWAAREARQRCVDEMAANVQDFLHGGRRGRVV
jgi:glycerate dehydrogenase